eukprot:g10167.t1
MVDHIRRFAPGGPSPFPMPPKGKKRKMRHASSSSSSPSSMTTLLLPHPPLPPLAASLDPRAVELCESLLSLHERLKGTVLNGLFYVLGGKFCIFDGEQPLRTAERISLVKIRNSITLGGAGGEIFSDRVKSLRVHMRLWECRAEVSLRAMNNEPVRNHGLQLTAGNRAEANFSERS